MQVVTRRHSPVDGYSDAFVEALWQLSKERGGGWINKSTVEALARDITIIERAMPQPPKMMPLPPRFA